MASNYEKRRLKELEELKSKLVSETAEEVSKTIESVDIEDVLNREAYDVFLDRESKKYVKVTVKYNVETGQAQVSSVETIADSQPLALYKIHETLSRKVLGLNY